MASLKFKTFKGTEAEPEATVTIPLGVLRGATKLMPKRAASALEEKGIDLNEIVELSHKGDIQGTLVEIEGSQGKRKSNHIHQIGEVLSNCRTRG